MNNLYNIRARITYSENSLRTWPIKNGYRSLFDLGNDIKTTGIIREIEGDELEKGETTDVKISFFSNEPFKNIKKGYVFNFYEWPNLIGSGIIEEILGWE